MQTSVNNSMEIGLPGQLYGTGPHFIDDFVNGSMQLDEVTITAANLATTLTIDGTAVTVNVAVEAKTKAELVALLIAAVNTAALGVTASDGSATDKMYVRADVHGTGFTAVGTTNCSVEYKVLNEDSVPFGVAVVRDTWSGLAKSAHLPSLTEEITTLGIFLGVTIRSHINENGYNGANNPGYAAYSAMNVIRRGLVYVQVETTVSLGEQAYVRFSADTSAGEQLGAFRNDADTSDAVALPHSTFETAASAGGIALLNLGMTVI